LDLMGELRGMAVVVVVVVVVMWGLRDVVLE
jgi:hypothetical protein